MHITKIWNFILGNEKMVESFLTDKMKYTGAILIKKMDEQGKKPDAAFWYYSPDIQTWKLIIGEQKVSKEGPKKMYREIQKILRRYSQEIKDISLDDISITKLDSEVIQLLKQAIHTGPDIAGIRFRNNVINGTLIEDAYIYRLI